MAISSINIFSNKELFFGLSDDQMRSLASVADGRIYEDRELLFSEGDMGDSLFIIENGSIDLFKKKSEDSEIKIATLPAGAVMGEMTLVNIEHRSATARASGMAMAVILKNSSLMDLFNKDRELFIVLLINITRILSKRLRQTNEKLIAKN